MSNMAHLLSDIIVRDLIISLKVCVKNADFYKEYKDLLNDLAFTINTMQQDLEEGSKHD